MVLEALGAMEAMEAMGFMGAMEATGFMGAMEVMGFMGATEALGVADMVAGPEATGTSVATVGPAKPQVSMEFSAASALGLHK